MKISVNFKVSGGETRVWTVFGLDVEQMYFGMKLLR